MEPPYIDFSGKGSYEEDAVFKKTQGMRFKYFLKYTSTFVVNLKFHVENAPLSHFPYIRNVPCFGRYINKRQ